MGTLTEYGEKRNFDVTPEPVGREDSSGDELRFVVQHHLARADHFDFRLEWRGALLSWAVPKGPSFNPKDRRLAVRVEDHPLEYRHFEGTIPKGEYGGGTVMLWDEGVWEPLANVDEGLETGSLKFLLRGRRLRGRWALVRMQNKAGEDGENWLLLKERDEFAKEEDGISQYAASVRTGRTMAEIERGEASALPKNPFSHAEVQLAKLAKTIPEGDGWLFELKYDGYRVLAFVEEHRARLVTRSGVDCTQRFRNVADALVRMANGRAMVLDGEMAVADASGRTDFQALQGYLKKPGGNLVYMVFDLLALDGEDLRFRPLAERKGLLEDLMKGAPAGLQYSRHVEGGGKACFFAACEMGMEGIVAKRADAPYTGGRSGSWLKLKCGARQEFVVGGFTRTEKKAAGFSALLLGVYENGGLVYAGRVGTGFSRAVTEELWRKFQPLIRPDCPFQNPPKKRPDETFTWLSPALVAEVQFAEWTEEGLLRQASFKGLRADKDPKTVVRETPQDTDVPTEETEEETVETVQGSQESITVAGVRVTSPDKVIFERPPVTKAEVVRYYEQVAPRMLPFVRRRILSILRCPRGVQSSCFYKKHPGPGSRGVLTIPVTNSEGETEEYFYIEDMEGLLSEAQMGTLEFHTWGSRVETLEQPDVMVFDLDPDEGLDLSAVRQGVRDLKGVLDELNLASFLKTSGGKGYHVAVPFEPSADWEAFYAFARRVAEVLERQWPDRYTTNIRKNKRAGKIFIDWMRNGRGATSVAPYSLRARPGAKVSMPIAWDELDKVAPGGIDMAEALRRLRVPDPWQGFFDHARRLKP